MKLSKFVAPFAWHCAGALTTPAAMVIGLLIVGSPAGASSLPAQSSLRATAASSTVGPQYAVPPSA